MAASAVPTSTGAVIATPSGRASCMGRSVIADATKGTASVSTSTRVDWMIEIAGRSALTVVLKLRTKLR